MTRTAVPGRRLVPSRSAMSKVGSFALSTVLGSAVSVLAIPVLIDRSGAGAWAELAVGQAVGTVLAVFVAFGWGVTGPYSVAIRDPAAARAYYLQSARIRAVLFVVAAVPAVVVVLLLARGQAFAAVLSALGVMAGNLGGGWLYIGRSRPHALLAFDTLPKVGAVLVGVVLVLLGAELWVYAAVGLVAGVGTAVIAVGSAVRLAPTSVPDERARGAFGVLREQVSAVVVASTAALYVSAPLLVVSALAPAATPVYAIADRITKFSLNGINPVAQVLQGWVPTEDRVDLVRRCRTATLASATLGVAGGLVLLPVLLVGAPLLTGGRVQLTPLLAVLFAGVVGAAVAFLLSEVAVTVAQLTSMRRAFRAIAATS